MKQFWPVIHLKNAQLMQDNILLAIEVGATGVWLINHENEPRTTIQAYAVAKRLVDLNKSGLKIGCNFLVGEASNELRLAPEGLENVWSDRCGWTGKEFDPHECDRIGNEKVTRGITFWGSYAFKHQHDIPIDYKHLKQAEPVLDVLVTSGPATGQACDPEKLRRIRELWIRPVAVASGVTPKNAATFLPYVDIILCATGISETFHKLNRKKTTDLANIIKGWA